MYKNKLSYSKAITLLFMTHLSMLALIFIRGSVVAPLHFIVLTGAVIGLDVGYLLITLTYKQMTYTLDFMLLGILNISLIFQSCFGEIQLSVKHLISCIMCLISCEFGFLLTRNHEWIRKQKKYIYILIFLLFIAIIFFTDNQKKWITIGSFSVQPSEFIKPCFILVCAASIVELHKKIKIGFFYISKDSFILCILTMLIFALQWWCHDLGSLPTFGMIFLCALFCRFCYPKEKISKRMIVIVGLTGVLLLIAAWSFAPEYVQKRLHADIWADRYGDGYQQCEALIGIAKGGWLGLGAGNGSLYKIFAHDSDIVFATICEEWGLLYAFLTVLLILIMLMTVLMNPPKNYYHAMMTAGVTACFLMQMSLNIFGSCNLIPFTGVTLPFLSTGGSSLMSCGFLVGMLKAGQSPLFHHDIMKRKKQRLKQKQARQAKKSQKKVNA
ncbi:MAG: FtsW/RodA/SpoVE family cell cycle protein [Oscillospiraceae bacterium]|nr:FtsW/RodA/SpoVE family cell cycle protein [Oscillospiraceae bacterium]